ncbi:MAG: hypothetical protein ACRD1V_07720 [Vicinamibacterales bacterium]
MLTNRALHANTHGAFFSLIIDVLPLVLAIVYAMRPTERRLALMRPLSLAAIFAALGSVVGGIAMVLNGAGGTSTFTIQTFRTISRGISEAMVPIYFGFGCLTVAWLLVTVGMKRASD